MQFSAVLDISTLDGSNGFRLDGVGVQDRSGYSVSNAGDVNGDGFDDIIIGAPKAGDSYVIFGKGTAFSASMLLSGLTGVNGFRIDGSSSGETGRSVSSAGDINGDGFDDLIIGAPYRSSTGRSYVVFGKDSGFAATVSVSSLDGSDGFQINGIDPVDHSGISVDSAGDINGDGYDDIIIGARWANAGGNSDAGESYVVFGKASGFSADIDLSTLDGTTGFRLDGVAVNDFAGRAVAGAGDVNGDGFDDLIIGAYGAGIVNLGHSYVVFGKASGFAASMPLSGLTGTDGFVFVGSQNGGKTGTSVSSAGDINGDGFDDVIIGGHNVDVGANVDAGASYVVFGKAGGFSATIGPGSLDGSNGFVILGLAGDDQSGFSVSGAGDVNGDGFDDLIIGAPEDPFNGLVAGKSYVVFGKAGGFSSTLNLATLDGSNGFRLDGEDDNGRSGISVSGAGDLNGDGFGDLIVGAPFSDAGAPGSFSAAGQSHVIFGVKETVDALTLIGAGGDQLMLGGTQDDTISGLGGDDVLRGFEGNDLFEGGDGDDEIDGGSGVDTATYQAAGGGVTVYLTFTGLDTGGAGTDTLIDIENLTGTGFDDRLVGDSGDNVLDGDAGNDVLKGKGGNDTFQGGEGDDKIIGGAGNDIMHGGAGADILIALAGVDQLNGGDHGDFLYGGSENDVLNGDAGNDKLNGNLGVDALNGGDGVDDLRGGGQNDTLNGGADNDFLFGENHLDTLFGGAGNDSLTGGVGGGAFDGFTDTFVYKDTGDGGGGFDKIKDFENGIDVMDLQSFGFANFAAVQALTSNSGVNMRINFGGGDVLFVENFQVADFDAGDVLI